MSDATAAPAGGTRRRLDHVDAMRPIKQAAVISTHAIIFLAPVGLAQTNLLIFTHFSREAFLFVSACMLAYSYRDVARLDLGHYWRRRFLSVGVPYLAWTVIYFVYLSLVARATFPYYHVNVHELVSLHALRHLGHLVATGYYHLYYLLVILEFYVIFPVLLRAVQWARRWHGRLLLLALLAQVLYCAFWPQIFSLFVRAHLLTNERGFWETRLVTSYTFYLVAGVIVAMHLAEVHDWICAHRPLILIGTLVAGVGAALLNNWHLAGEVGRIVVPGVNPFAVLVIPYNVGAILCVYLLGVYLVSPQRSLRTRAAVKSGSDNAYGIYLSQMVWIPLLVRLWSHFHPRVHWAVLTGFSVVIVYLAGFAFSALVSRTPLARAVTGRGQVSWASLMLRRRIAPAPLEVDASDGPLDLTAND
jgi:peptidoglycan/LPS O-acetylase OafA/YrhL